MVILFKASRQSSKVMGSELDSGLKHLAWPCRFVALYRLSRRRDWFRTCGRENWKGFALAKLANEKDTKVRMNSSLIIVHHL